MIKHLQIKIDESLHKKFKIKCFYDGIDMSEKIRKFIESEVKNDRNIGGRI